MLAKAVGLFTFAFLALLSSVVFINRSQAQEAGRNSPPVIPKTWDDEAVASLEVPLAEANASPVHIPADYYYRMPVRPIPSRPSVCTIWVGVQSTERMR